MRISTQSFYEQSQTAMSSQQGSLLRVQQQMGNMTRVLSPADDPIGATRALTVSQSIALHTQYAASRAQATQTLSMEENALQSVTSLLQDVKTMLIQAGNGTLSDADRSSIATALQSQLNQLQGLANSDDGNGQYLFAGFRSANPPFVTDPDGSIAYVGDQGQRMVQVDVARQMAASNDGRSIFQSVQSGAGYVSNAGSTNSGSGVFSAVTVADPTNADYGKDFSIRFTTDATGTLQYQVDSTDQPPISLVPPSRFVANQPISFGGLQLSISGTPDAGDTFDVKTAKNAGTSIFDAITDAIGALQQPLDNGNSSDRASLLNALSTANRKVTNTHDNVLTVRASVGSRLQELDALNTTGSNRSLLDKTQLSDLQDLDYASAISEFYQRQTALEATQQVFVKIQKLSLFNYL